MLAVIVLFDRFTALDAVGPYEVLSSLPGTEVIFAAHAPGPVANEKGTLRLIADTALAGVPHADVIVVPGGPGQHARMTDEALLGWLRDVDAGSAWTTSVCTGSLLLAAAGLLKGRRATTHWLAMDQLAGLGTVPAAGRVVTDGKYMTAAGVSAGLDMALALAGMLAGHAAAQSVQLALEYNPQPPTRRGPSSPRLRPSPTPCAPAAAPS
ncbi:MAG: DJ-1/PfpI family protein [Streptosporangiaceae bacterium]